LLFYTFIYMQNETIKYLQSLIGHLFEPELITEMSQYEIWTLPGDIYLNEYKQEKPLIPFIIEGKIKIVRKDFSGKELIYYPVMQYQCCILSISYALRQAWNETVLLRNDQRAEVYTLTETKILGLPLHLADDWLNKYASWRKFVISLYQDRLRELIEQHEVTTVQKNEIEYQNGQITSSIQYAQRIQRAIFPPQNILDDISNDYFVMFKPRDIVSGDFYWISKENNSIIIAAADATGHGVPGAFMSMLGIAYLNELKDAAEHNELKPHLILERLRDKVKSSLRQTGKADEAKDGMDIALCMIEKDTLKLQYSGAHNPMFIIRKEVHGYELTSLKPDKQPIGIYLKETPFTNKEFQLKKGDCIYLLSDGYVDQFGGERIEKFKIRRFRDFLITIQGKNMTEQHHIIENELKNWMGNHEQIDDILVMGIKV